MDELTRFIDMADKALSRDLCDHCLGRLFALVGSGMTNEERGKFLRKAVTDIRIQRGEKPPAYSRCWLCDDIFQHLDRFAGAVKDALEGLEFNNFLIGTRVDPLIQEREERLWGEVGGAMAEPIKAELNREIGKKVEAAIGKPVEFANPDVVAIVDTRFNHVTLNISPLFIYGRYRKYSREIPQTVWPCRNCRGKGCERCGFTGKMYQTSVQEIIGGPILEMTGGKKHFFHGMGREDIDARMLGNGRPFVIEIREPRRRILDFESLQERINASGVVEVSDLRPSCREELRRIKSAAPDKTYRVAVRPDGKVDKGKLDEVISSFKGLNIIQQTPLRVVHRRTDRARERKIKDIKLESFDEDGFVIVLTAESGTYIKEWVHGDQGRTRPSLSEALGVPCEVLWLDVIKIADESGEE